MSEAKAISNPILLHVFCTSIEGAINYWAYVCKYHWLLAGTESEPDLTGFYATVTSDERDWKDELKIDANTIRNGIELIASGEVTTNCVVKEICRKLLSNHEDAVGDVDADVADAIVQVGLFKQIVYG